MESFQKNRRQPKKLPVIAKCIYRIGVLCLLLGIIWAIKDLADSRDWPERVTEINHNRSDVAVTDGGKVLLPNDNEVKLPKEDTCQNEGRPYECRHSINLTLRHTW